MAVVLAVIVMLTSVFSVMSVTTLRSQQMAARLDNLRKEARERYVARYGVVTQCDQLGMDGFTWLRDPWPWEFQTRRER